MNVVEEMAIAAGVPKPRVYLIDEPDPNAFATGRDPQHASIAVTTGLLTTMNREELQGVIAGRAARRGAPPERLGDAPAARDPVLAELEGA
jgi:heat shock protein HtpX